MIVSSLSTFMGDFTSEWFSQFFIIRSYILTYDNIYDRGFLHHLIKYSNVWSVSITHLIARNYKTPQDPILIILSDTWIILVISMSFVRLTQSELNMRSYIITPPFVFLLNHFTIPSHNERPISCLTLHIL